MSRVAQRTIKLLIAGAVVLCALGGGLTAYLSTHAANAVHAVTNSQHQLTEISYQGKDGVDALTLLKSHAAVQVKHYSFGDLVTAINGVAGNGPKYWTFYINGKEAAVGASAYVTKADDTLMWRLQ